MKVLLFRGKGFLPWLVRFQTRSPYHHAAIALPTGEYYEAAFKGGVVRHSSITAERAKSVSVDVFNVETTPEQDRQICDFLKEQHGKPYDITMVLRFVTRKQATRKTKGKWFCSEMVYAAFLAAGINLFNRAEPWEVSPGALSWSPLMNYERTVKL